ncbi:GTP 3',8-cyclase MoaA [Pimelobacter simplex]|uniref:GTP 3',8-cyclase MoaA n=1 Tax=Nocardioides simplex TaxID=2045 RepID=UPI0021501E72|nr:GTP 3',8-cyclase MoaA [Pimelobacter simplex]UUW92757.1 GTP 3',8-cyclase MoaA [Pimelobacter simplex]UUW98728.1 GTP 3',8-cyclase MoaA [Pimelobacter simplex]
MPVFLALPQVRSTAEAVDRPANTRLIDRYGRVAQDLRVSLTDRCNLRCTYCMPADGLTWAPTEALLTDQELVRLITIAVGQLGVREVRFTGGEPLLRRGLEGIVASTARLSPRPDISLTTNGIGLVHRAKELASAGLNRLNVSLDSVRRDTFTEITRRDRLDDVLSGLDAAKAAGLTPIKLNSVLMRGINDDEGPGLLRFAIAEGYELRFIEQMPLDAQHSWDRDAMVGRDEILANLRVEFELAEAHSALRGSAPAELWYVNGTTTTVGIIASVGAPFCGSCDRTRLTADGQVRTCLFATSETDLRGPLRGGASDEEIAKRWRDAMWGKAWGHGINDNGFQQPDRPMSAIGG